METAQMSSFMGMIYHQKELLEAEFSKYKKQLEQLEKYYGEVSEVLSDVDDEKIRKKLNHLTKILVQIQNAIFGLNESWNNLEIAKAYLETLEKE